MASLPSVAVTGIPKLDAEFRRNPSSSLPSEKSSGLSYQRSQKINHLNGSADLRFLDFGEALSLIREGTSVKTSYYVPLLQECVNTNSISKARMIHAHIIKTGTHEDIFTMTFLVNVYAKCGTMKEARKIFDHLPKRNVVSWTALMTGYVHNDEPEVAIQVFLEMLDVGAYPTNYTLGIILSACSSLYSTELGRQLHGYIVKYRIESDTSIGNSLCSLYSKCGSLKSAVRSFWRIREKNVISWTTVISACGDNGDAGMSLKLFTQMLCEGIEPNEYTLTSALSSCCTMLALRSGKQIHSLSVKLGYGSNLPVKNSVMYLYLKCGCVDYAQKLLNGMQSISLVTWNATIAGHAQVMELAKDEYSARSSGTEALNIFTKLNRSGHKPDLFTFSSVLTVCSGLMALEQGEQIHAQTIKTGFLSDVVVGTALVNMYNKCGSIEKASKAFVEMTMRTLISWTSMITAFCQHGWCQQALQLFEDMRLAGVRPNKVTFMGVLSACSRAGMVDEALRYFEMMRNEYKIRPGMDHYACLIDMYVRLGQLVEAFDFVQKMEFEPNEFIWSMLIAGCRSHGNLELGFYAAEKLVELQPKDTETYIMLLNMYLSAGRWKDVSRLRKLMKDEKIGKLRDWSWISIKDKTYSFKANDSLHPPSSDIEELLSDLLEKAKGLGYESHETSEVTDEEGQEMAFYSTFHHSEKLAVAFGLLNTSNLVPIRVTKSISICRDCHNFIKLVSLLTAREIIIRDSKQLHKFVDGQCSCGDFTGLL
ncbi:E motif [Dillenia turbinata]|uniref:E motif n=1 Tax=Dillenia turbinata TaxID=194707 RepID=A0AAN8ZND9_9MAGN